jgi:hypothetical protein
MRVKAAGSTVWINPNSVFLVGPIVDDNTQKPLVGRSRVMSAGGIVFDVDEGVESLVRQIEMERHETYQ